MSMTQLLFSFQGRLNRKPYWTMAITTTVVFILLLLNRGYAARVRARIPPRDDSDPRHPIHPADLDRSRPRRQTAPRPRQVRVVAPRLLCPADNFEHGRRSNGGCAIHRPAYRQFRHQRLGVRRDRLPARDGRAQSLRPRPAKRAGVEGATALAAYALTP